MNPSLDLLLSLLFKLQTNGDAHLVLVPLTLRHLLVDQTLQLGLQDVHLQLQEREERNDVHRWVRGHVKIDQRVRLLRVPRLGQQLLFIKHLERLHRLVHRVVRAAGHAGARYLSQDQSGDGARDYPGHRQELRRQRLQTYRSWTVPFRANSVVGGDGAMMRFVLFVNVAATTESVALAVQALLLLLAEQATASFPPAVSFTSELVEHWHGNWIRVERWWTVEDRRWIDVCRLCCLLN